MRVESLEDRTTPASPPIRPGFALDGPTFIDNTPAVFPASPNIAVGTAHIVTVTNATIQWQTAPTSKTAPGIPIKQSLKTFFASQLDGTFGSPRVIFDQVANRFVIVAVENKTSLATSRIRLAVSDDADPNGTWFRFFIDGDSDLAGADYANALGLAADEQAVYVTANQSLFSNDQYQDARVYIVDKGVSNGWYAGQAATFRRFDPDTSGPAANSFALAPAHVYGTPPAGNTGTYLVSYNGLASGVGTNEAIQVIRIDNPLAVSPTFTTTPIDVGDIDDTAAALPDAPQTGSTVLIDTGDRRVSNVVWQGDRLYFAGTVNPTAGPNAGQATAHWFQVRTTDNTVEGQGDIGGEEVAAGLHTYVPSIAVDELGDLAVTFNGSHAAGFVKSYYVAKTAAEAAMPAPVTLDTGTGDTYVRRPNNTGPTSPWGEYSATAVAPNRRVFYTFNAYAAPKDPNPPAGTDAGRWATRAGAFSFNWPPDANDPTPLGTQTVQEDSTPLDIDLDTHFKDFETNASNTLTYAVVANGDPTVITATIVGRNVLRLTFTPNANGVIGLTIRATDPGTASAAAASTDHRFSVSIIPINDPPVAVPDNYSVDEDDSLTVSAAQGVLANDTDPDTPDSKTAILDTTALPAHAAEFTLNANGSFTYTPVANFSGTDTFRYSVKDAANVESDVVTVTITVNPLNDAPVAVNDAFSTVEDTPLTVNAPGVLGNDTDVDNPTSALTAVLGQGPAHAQSFTFNADGSFTYVPAANFSGTDTFTYRANDGTALSALAATVTITVTPVDDAPVATDDTYQVNEDQTLTVPAPGILGNDLEFDGQPLTLTPLSNTQHGSLTLNADGSFTYVPVANFSGTDTFTYRVSDGTTLSNIATVTITVNAVNDAPVATADKYKTPEDTPLHVAAPGVLANDTDVDNPAAGLGAILVQGPAHALSFTLNPDGSFDYTPVANFSGTDSFTYQASDGTSQSGTVTVTLTVTPVQDAPVANDDAAASAGRPVRINVLANDTDADRDVLRVMNYAPPAKGKLVRSGTALVYTPNPGATGSDSFTYTVSDGHGNTDTATVTVTLVDTVAPTVQSVRLFYGPNRFIDLRSLARTTLPWESIQRIEVVFSEDVNVGAASLTLTGLGGAIGTTFSYTSVTRTATWTPTAPLGIGRFTVRLAAAGVTDLAGNPLAANWARSFGLLPGDFNGDGVVTDADLTGIKSRFNTSDRFADIDGNGLVNQGDLDKATANKGKRLP